MIKKIYEDCIEFVEIGLKTFVSFVFKKLGKTLPVKKKSKTNHHLPTAAKRNLYPKRSAFVSFKSK